MKKLQQTGKEVKSWDARVDELMRAALCAEADSEQEQSALVALGNMLSIAELMMEEVS